MHHNMLDIGKLVERLLRSTEEVLEAHSDRNASSASTRRSRADTAFSDSLGVVYTAVSRLETRLRNAPDAAGKAACARAWLEPHLERKLFLRLEVLLNLVRDQAGAALATAGPSRCSAFATLMYAGSTACTLLEFTCRMASTANTHDSGQAVGLEAVAAMAQVGFMTAVADAVRGMVTATAIARSDAGALRTPHQHALQAQHNTFTSSLASTMGWYTLVVAQLVLNRFRVLETAGSGGGPSTSASAQASSQAFQLTESLADSQLLASTAAVLLDCPPILTAEVLAQCSAETLFSAVRKAAENVAKAMCLVGVVQSRMASYEFPQGRLVAAKLLHAARHTAVVRLQVALLDQLAAHAGLGAEMEGEDEAGEGQEGEQAGAWAGSSGSWWFALEEAQRGQLLGVEERGAGQGEVQTRSQTAGWLEDYHCNSVFVFYDWSVSWAVQPDAEAGVPARPPPLLVARLVARAAEALCRLCRGQGLGGAYAPAPTWEFAKMQVLLCEMVPRQAAVDFLPLATTRACLPHWLEAAGWAVALMSDATAAAMGRLPATQRGGPPRRMFTSAMAQEGSQAGTLMYMLQRIINLTQQLCGFKALTAAAQADVRRRLFRCGLAASLDHTLRLQYSAKDSGTPYAEELLRCAALFTAATSDLKLLPMLPPATSPGGNGRDSSSGGGGGGSSGGGGGSATGQQGSSGDAADGSGQRPQLGLLLTLSKQAAMLTRALEAVASPGASAAGSQGQGQGEEERRMPLIDWSTDVLTALLSAVMCIEGEVLRLVAAVQEFAAQHSGDDGGGEETGTAERPGAGCVDEAHEALVLAMRAACNLAAPWAWQLAADLAAAAALAGTGEPDGRLLHASSTGAAALSELLPRVARWCHDPIVLLHPTHLLACQPHRLLAATCALAAALPAGADNRAQLGEVAVPCLVVSLAAHKTMSSQVFSWLVQPPGAAGSSGACCPSSSRGASTCAGCLEDPLRAAAQQVLISSRAPKAVHAMVALMAHASVAAERGGAVQGPQRGGGDGVGREQGRAWEGTEEGFLPFAIALDAHLKDWLDSEEAQEGMQGGEQGLAEGSGPADRGVGQRDARVPLAPPPTPAGVPPPTPAGVPPPLPLLPGQAGALPQLRMCGNPRCGNFSGESEGELPFKQCGGCRAVRYCGAECQRAHWREGHKAECKKLTAVAVGK